MDSPFTDSCHFENNGEEKNLCLNVSRTYLLRERPNLYECTRKYWKLNGERAMNAELVFAICSGVIIGVFRPFRWFKSKEYLGRWEFEGEEIADSPYLLMTISHLTGKMQNPVMYINL